MMSPQNFSCRNMPTSTWRNFDGPACVHGAERKPLARYNSSACVFAVNAKQSLSFRGGTSSIRIKSSDPVTDLRHVTGPPPEESGCNPMTREFKSWWSLHIFANAVKGEYRHLLDSESMDFLETVGVTSHAREKTIEKGQILFRAQLGHSLQDGYDQFAKEVLPGEWIVPFGEDRLRPWHDRAQEGRVNPKGVPVFYAALDKKTAVAEMRPWKGSYVSYGRFRAARDLRMVDCSTDPKKEKPGSVLPACFYMSEPDSKEREKSVWHHIDEAFSTPITRNDDLADYAPTQILSECFRREGFDGIVFRSSIETGINVVLFQLDEVEFLDSDIVKITNLSIDFEASGDGCFNDGVAVI